jgi:hypothetical protein
VAVYTTDELDRELRQAEIITNLHQFTYDTNVSEVVQTLHTYTIVVSQDCDLLWDYQAKINNQRRDLNGVLIYEAESVAEIRARLAGGDILRRIRRHGEERYHILNSATANLDLLGEGLPELIVDFRRFFTLPADEIYRQ